MKDKTKVMPIQFVVRILNHTVMPKGWLLVEVEDHRGWLYCYETTEKITTELSEPFEASQPECRAARAAARAAARKELGPFPKCGACDDETECLCR